LGIDALDQVLPAAGFAAGQPAVFTVEGLTMYLPERDAKELLTTLAALGGTGSRLAVNFRVGFEADNSAGARVRALVGRGLLALGREPFRFQLPPEGVPAFLERTGWTAQQVLSAPQVANKYLAETGLPITRLSPHASVALGVSRAK
jgi:O-methyltransferase involved in polyketide biosynthesis